MSQAPDIARCEPHSTIGAGLLDFAALRAAPLERDPFTFTIVPNFVSPARLPSVVAGFPTGLGAGSHPLGLLKPAGDFKALLDELRGDAFRAAIEAKFDIDLAGLPTLCTVRAMTSAKDGRIHTDSSSKVITVLLYLNEAWDCDGGRLRLLRSADDLDDYAAEIPPTNGTLLVFRRSDTSWHGHKPFVGPRKAIQFNWVTGSSSQMREAARHGITHLMKRFVIRAVGPSVARAAD